MPPKKKKTTRKSKSTKKKRAGLYRFRMPLIAVAIIAVAASGLYLLQVLPEGSSPPPKPGKPASEPVSAYQVLEDVRIEVESLLLRNGASLEGIRDSLIGDTLVFEVSGEFPSDYLMNGLRDRLKRISQQLELEVDPEQARFRVLLKRRDLCRVEFTEPRQEAIGPGGGPRMAIVMDDLGRDLSTARQVLALEIPVTFSILPGTANARRIATMAHRARREVLVHIPMEPKGFPGVNPGSDALLVSHSPKELRSRLNTFWQKVPHASGGNNHMGSRFTENADAMGTVLDFMHEKALFFIDSRTSPRSVGYSMALKRGVDTAARDVFLDNDQDVESTRAQVRKLIARALREGEAIGICHPYPETIEALRLEARTLEEKGVRVVPVSDLLGQAGS